MLSMRKSLPVEAWVVYNDLRGNGVILSCFNLVLVSGDIVVYEEAGESGVFSWIEMSSFPIKNGDQPEIAVGYDFQPGTWFLDRKSAEARLKEVQTASNRRKQREQERNRG